MSSGAALRAQPIEANGLSGLEIVSHVLLGPDDRTPRPAPPAHGARAALEAAVLAALRRPPCLVTFSGGRDSSAMLAIATRLAAREGLPAPIPITGRYHAPEAAEDEWQEVLIAELGVDEWWRRQYGDELDLVGPVATDLFRREGLPYPFNLHLVEPLIAEAAGGSLITGVGGDQALHRAGAFRDVLALRRRPSARDLAWTAIGLAPRPARRRMLRGRVELTFPWLTAEANAELTRGALEQELAEAVTWRRQVVEVWRSRTMQLNLHRLGGLAARHDVALHHPFADPGFVAALARDGGRFGFPSRTAAMAWLFSDALPRQLIARPTKATFDGVLFNRHARAFVAELDEGVLAEALAALGVAALADPRALLAEWRGPRPRANSFLLLQACWMALRR
ncbi:MAG TPA: asparagine synthase-related protein [Baekduia sp.]|nr:asparagine synthase-related protein [Baekduia sp.]